MTAENSRPRPPSAPDAQDGGNGSAPGTGEPPVVLVTGSGGTIGASICARFASHGYRVVGGDLAPSASDSTGGPVPLDVRSGDSCRAAVREAISRHGRLDVLINNAGINARGTAAEMPEDVWRDVLDVNLNGTFRMCQAAFPELKRATGGAIVNLSSSAALVAIPGTAIYGVSKAAITHLTKVLAVEWAPYGIRVNAVAPTIVPSGMTADILTDPGYMARKLDTIPLHRPATPDEVAAAVYWLASSDAAMTTGLTLPVDGGVHVR